MKAIRNLFKSITPFEYCLWGCAAAAIVLSFVLCGNSAWYNMIGSLLGATALILCAKGNVLGTVFNVVFAAYYGVVSFFTRYYGELIICLCMSVPISIAALVSWLKHPFQGNKAEVAVRRLPLWEYGVVAALGAVAAVAFYFILRALNTSSLLLSSISIFTSFVASVLAQRRSPVYALAYVCNDIVLIALWTIASMQNTENVALVVCSGVFVFEDLYGYVCWTRRLKRQSAERSAAAEASDATSDPPPEQSE